MKKFFLTLGIAIMGSGILFAQISINATDGINIGNALKVTGNEIKVSQKITAEKNLTFSPLGSIVFNFAKCNLTISNDISSSSIIGPSFPSSENTTLGTSVSPVNYGAITPSVTNFMDLGSETRYFRYLYAQFPVFKNNPQITSDLRQKENIRDLQDATSLLTQLHPVSFDFKNVDSLENDSELKNKVGFIAQEIQNVLPHSVGYLPVADIYTVDYISLIPYLVQAFQEGQNQISELQEQVDALQEIVRSLLAQQNTNAPKNAPKQSPKNTVTEEKLFQNIPNPFSEKTVIRYELPKTAGNAYLQVFDMGGRMLQNIHLPHQEIGQVEISAGELMPGTYTYSLVVSGKVIDSKRMVITQ